MQTDGSTAGLQAALAKAFDEWDEATINQTIDALDEEPNADVASALIRAAPGSGRDDLAWGVVHSVERLPAAIYGEAIAQCLAAAPPIISPWLSLLLGRMANGAAGGDARALLYVDAIVASVAERGLVAALATVLAATEAQFPSVAEVDWS